MTLLPSPLAHSTLGEKCASYLDHVTDNIPEFLHSLRPRLDPYLTYLSATPSAPSRRRSHSTSTNRPLLSVRLSSSVSDADFSYITPDYIVDPPASGAHAGQYADNAEDNEPDIIRLRHRGTIYPLHFRAYAIDDGVLNVGALRREAALKVGASNPNRVRLLYKGNLLKDDARPCKTEGLKQHSEVLCVVSEADANTPSDLSDQNGQMSDHMAGRPGSSSSRIGGDDDGEDGQVSPAPRKSKKKSNRKKKGKKTTTDTPPREELLGASSVPSSRPTSSGPAYMPPPAPNLKGLGALEQVSALVGYLQKEITPLCDEYVADPPAEAKKREFEHKKLSETILAQVLLKADGIEPDGDVTIRNARKALIKEAQANLDRLDQVEKL
ncbi:hypothetical protein N7532_010217 [Penicillium argentinense]|uniref:BAG domain-containing protein n=1 Tax=Penicillium argentinense TaxID=1131581 RepID=A0A9W9EP90_9EURO|nr:uncharacterized protein N7532_010217 [Penicillium argentinense]KAJ5085446.1 hypothetical protein N7532_010217 [Penicillium argentinense]